MTLNEVVVPGARDVRGSLDEPEAPTDTVVVACPPHPQFDGNRSDNRLVALADYLTEHGVACLRFDYGDWDEGYGEREDARNALRWARERYDSVGIFGFSFGGAIATLAGVDETADAIALLAPASRLTTELDAAAALGDVDVPLKVLYGTRDDTADWKPLVERAKELGFETEEFSADHFFIGQEAKVAGRLGEFLVERL
ncbi:alpha/beta hydrolase [Haladaptatus sp. T7]|uniref:alpha/beta hydrolase n=1 Tax=Haladaptatus sp. T7 TaxID=2029368 RepID=UPI0021A2555D|nr:alpha/beta hydrolase [Haladaptatus sp. T7]GKZ13021.1 alpha/beta hydrolase [Haladaptatus sp. T7]